ncbi:unnamed protein product [Acanthoscelides obtectus]|uniref:Uncharacterized protein n=1 Tax=Acanthoscelides obtectus TaxID=200917 RepID=A0A9P0PF80_ACAOB|nr:unnamed protein product [Acanthoscelides obtectus]CAK1671907.1 hypothetical protein AOBTE_LOCUS28528 [Acanthoscelides obtectus]
MIVNLDNETDQPDCQELPTVDNTNTDKDIINETEQTDYHELPFVIDKTNTNEDELDKDDETRHSNNQHPVVTIPISDQPLNFGQNQIIFGTPGGTFVRRRVGEEFNQECETWWR